MSATFFGEINELDSRAVWYSDEESSDEEDNSIKDKSPDLRKAINHESVMDEIQFDYCSLREHKNQLYETCLVTLSSKPKYKNFRISEDSYLTAIGHFGSIGKVYTWTNKNQHKSLWIMLDSSHSYLSSYLVNYFVEKFLQLIDSLFKFQGDSGIIILSQQASSGDQLEYLTSHPVSKLPFTGEQLKPPHLIKNHFEASVFEYTTVTSRPSSIVCLPDPKNHWFDSLSDWPTLPEVIVKQILQDDSLDQTLIFT